MKNYPCYHCGGDEMIHQSETYHCPLGGVDRLKPIWLETTYLPDKSEDEQELRDLVQSLLKRIEILEKSLEYTDRRITNHVNNCHGDF